jgi:spore germination protein GerM
MRRRLLVALLGASIAVSLGGCGIPLSRSAEPTAERSLPPLLSNAPATTAPAPKPPPVATEHANHLVVYLVDATGQHLVAVKRNWPDKVTPTVALNVLGLGPESQDPRGLKSFLAAAPREPVSIGRNGVAKVTLDESTFSVLFGASLYVPLAQIVFTLMANFSNIKGVNFFLAGKPPVLFNYTPNGSVSPQPVTEQTYAALKPLPPRPSR